MITSVLSGFRGQIALFLLYVWLLPGLESLRRDSPAVRLAGAGSSNLIVPPASAGAASAGSVAAPLPVTARQETLKAAAAAARPEGGPSQPEMAAFKSVGTDNLVDLFSGDFSYNIPLLDVGGYPVNIFYNSGVGMEQEASWVGLGWNINPGTITRNMRGLPDDFNGTDKITKTQYSRPEQTWGVGVGGSVEVFGLDALKLGLSAGIFYNNQRGVGLEAGIRPSVGLGATSGDEKTAPLTLGWGLKMNSQSGTSQTFSIKLDQAQKGDAAASSYTASLGYHSRAGLQSLHLDAEWYKNKMTEITKKDGSTETRNIRHSQTAGTSISFAYPSVTPSIRSRIRRQNISLDIKGGGEVFGVFTNASLTGYYNRSYIPDNQVTITQPAYGMLYMTDGQKDRSGLLDFNRLNDGVYTPNAPTIAIPAYTYDVFSITGEGTGGSFRAYRGDLGYVSDPLLSVGGEGGHLGIDLGGGAYAKGGVNAEVVLTPSSAGPWVTGNLARNAMAFRPSGGRNQSVYFKNPGEKAIPDMVWQNAVGGEDLVRLKMTNLGMGMPTLMPSLLRYDDLRKLKPGQVSMLSEGTAQKQRDKRGQVISYLTAEEAARAGMSTRIRFINQGNLLGDGVIYGCGNAGFDSMERWTPASRSAVPGTTGDQGGYRRSHHISQVDVLGTDGRKYVYGIPVYNIRQCDYSFNKGGSDANAAAQKIFYKDGTDNIPHGNKEGKDHYVESQVMPAYTHSFLLTALLSPNYVDKTGNGITEDDAGDAVKFNYGKLDKPLGWRTPAALDSASFSQGLRTDRNDDKAHFIYGERESWYLYSIESKNMVARFYVSENRCDSRTVRGQSGGLGTEGALRLEKISLYSKAELLNNFQPKPVKTVHFVYDYELCPMSPNSVASVPGGSSINPEKGKLTLRKIEFSYNGNKRRHNRYVFSYGANRRYDFTASDRWGNYKPASANPGGLLNPDYLYSDQLRSRADTNAAPWAIRQIQLPSGGKLKVDYESDDYGYVQNRVAADMFRIVGFGVDKEASRGYNNNRLYQDKNNDFDYIYVQVSGNLKFDQDPALARREIAAKYLANMSQSRQLFMKLFVSITPGNSASSAEMIPVYAELDEGAGAEAYGAVKNHPGIIYLKVKKLDNGFTPMVQTSLQFMKNFLPAKAYPGYDVSDEGGAKQVIRALGGLYRSAKETFRNGMKLFKEEGKCRWVQTEQSFIRLSTPGRNKLGGGHRVRRITIDDNWQAMTARNGKPAMASATYGQEYFYTKKELVNGELKEISSGVANWEPVLGGEENPHREIMSFFNKNKLSTFDYGSVELPLAEMFFPSASVGYSRVEVRSIHRDTVKNAPGIQVTEFYTAREFPTRYNYTPLEEYGAKDAFEPSPILRLLKVDATRAVALSQGFKVELNDMHGRLKKQATYSPLDPVNPISYTENFYNAKQVGNNVFRFDHNFSVILGADGKVVKNAVIGREVELMTDFRQHKLETITANLHFNGDVVPAFFVPFLIPTWFMPVEKETDLYRSASVLKVVNHYAVLDSIVAMDKGSMVSTRNMVYDGETGEVLITRTHNEHNQPVYTFNYPAHWAYSGMGPAYRNIDLQADGLVFRGGQLSGGILDLSALESGDELYCFSGLDKGPAKANACDVPFFRQYMVKSQAKRIWAVNTNRLNGLNANWVFMDAEGQPYTADSVSVRVIRSGKRNMATQPVGSITCLNLPISAAGKLDFTNAAVIATTAATFKDHWRVDNEFLRKDSLVSKPTYTRIRVKKLWMQEGFTIVRSHHWENYDHVYPERSPVPNPGPYLKAYKWRGGGNFWNHSHIVYNRFVMRFGDGMSPLFPPNAGIYGGLLSLYPHLKNHSGLHGAGNSETAGLKGAVSLIPNRWYYSKTNDVWMRDQMLTTWNNLPVAVPHVVQNTSNPSEPYRINISSLIDEQRSLLQQQGTLALRYQVEYDYPGGLTDPSFRCFDGDVDPGSGRAPYVNLYYYICGNDDSIPVPGDTIANRRFQCDSFFVAESKCVSRYAAKSYLNPYTEGIWGNWRVDTTYVYYGNRQETDPAQFPDMRTAGVIQNHIPFWNFSAANTGRLARNLTAQGTWVWNSTITQYNRKGYDIENKDPLGRYNAGLYGYNQQLPVAVVNNSRYKEALFDGFEDYDYQSSTCATFCQPRRHAATGHFGSYLTTALAHTGKVSVQVPAAGELSFTAPVVAGANQENVYGLAFQPFGQIDNGNNGTINCGRLKSSGLTGNALTDTFSLVAGTEMLLSLWVKESAGDCHCKSYTQLSAEIRAGSNAVAMDTFYTAGPIIEGWQRIEGRFTVPANAGTCTVSLVNRGNVQGYFDDLRLQPAKANMKSFVYHPQSLRLTAELDENNFATLFEYDDDGTLVRLKKETERGVKTIKETRSAMQIPE